MLLDMLQAKFGELPRVITDRVRAIESQDELAALGTKLLSAKSLEDLGLNGKAWQIAVCREQSALCPTPHRKHTVCKTSYH